MSNQSNRKACPKPGCGGKLSAWRCGRCGLVLGHKGAFSLYRASAAAAVK